MVCVCVVYVDVYMYMCVYLMSGVYSLSSVGSGLTWY